MSGLAVIVVVVVVVVVVAGVVVGLAQKRHRRGLLKAQFGSEYDRTVADTSRRDGERDLQARAERHEQLDIAPLPSAEAARYRTEWRMVQERFVDAPAESVAMANALLTSAMRDRGYPAVDQDERVSLLSVDNADVVDEYRQGAAIEQRWRDQESVETEDLRQAMQHYRTVFDRVVGASRSDAAESQR